jgi:hypothetical protein
MAKCGKTCEIYSRVVGYHRPVQNWNHGKKAEFQDRVEFQENVSLTSCVVSSHTGAKVNDEIKTSSC